MSCFEPEAINRINPVVGLGEYPWSRFLQSLEVGAGAYLLLESYIKCTVRTLSQSVGVRGERKGEQY